MAATPRLREMDGNKKPLKSPCAALEQESKSVGQKGQLFHNGRNGRETKAKATTAPRTARSRRR